MYHFRLNISNIKLTNKSLSSCRDGICKQMDDYNKLSLPFDSFNYFVQSTGYCNVTLSDMVVNDARFFQVRSWILGKQFRLKQRGSFL
jgi:hypothetical protein